MRLLYITNGINGAGGLERVLSVKASYLAEHYAYDVSILCLNDGDKNPFYTFSNKIKTYSIAVSGNPIQYLLAYIEGIQQVVKKIQPDFISVCDDGLKAFFIPRILGNKIPIVYERHVSKLIELPVKVNWFQKGIVKLKWGLMNCLAKDFNVFVVLTKGNVAEWKHLKNLLVISNPNTFVSTEKAELLNEKVICVGKVSVQKGQDLLAKVWSQVVQQFPDWELHNYGKLDEAFFAQEDLPPNMFLHAPVQDIAAKYLESSIYVLPSRYEGFGMVLTEAMSFGIPCVAFDCNYGPGDIVINGEDGILVEAENTKELARNLIFLMKNEDNRKKMGSKALRNVQRFEVSTIIMQWDQLFKTLIH